MFYCMFYFTCDRSLVLLECTKSCSVLQLWQTSYDKMRLIDNNYFHERKDSMELAIFQSECVKHLEASKKQLLTGWFPECQRIFYVGNKRRLIPTMRDLVMPPFYLHNYNHSKYNNA